MVFEYMSQYIGEWKWSIAVVPLILLTIAPTAEAKYDFPVYRMHQYDIAQENYGSRSSLVSFEGRTASANQIARKTVLIKIEELTQSLFSSIMEKGPGAILILLPMEINQPSFPENVTQDQLNKIHEAERILIQSPSTPIPIYFSFENDELKSIYSEIESSSEFLGAAAILNAGNQVLHQFMVTGQQPTVEKKKLNVFESKLKGTEQGSKVILLTSKLDSFTPAFGLSRGANTGTGTALMLEIARLLSIIYEDDSTRPKVTVLFALMPADGFNYLASRDWLEALEREDAGLDKIDLAICLDGIGLDGPLYIHKTPKSQTSSKYFIDALKENKYGVNIQEVHRKINLGDERTWWQHERFAFKKIPSLTLSSLENPKSPIRSSMTDTYGMIDEKRFEANSLAISDAILSTVYQSNVDENDLSVSFESVKAWTRLMASEPRPAGNVTSRLTNDISKHLEKFSSENKIEKRPVCGDLTLYNQNEAVMSQFFVRPALFDLYLGALIFGYLGLIYMSIENFGILISIVGPILSKPGLFKKQKSA